VLTRASLTQFSELSSTKRWKKKKKKTQTKHKAPAFEPQNRDSFKATVTNASLAGKPYFSNANSYKCRITSDRVNKVATAPAARFTERRQKYKKKTFPTFKPLIYKAVEDAHSGRDNHRKIQDAETRRARFIQRRS